MCTSRKELLSWNLFEARAEVEKLRFTLREPRLEESSWNQWNFKKLNHHNLISFEFQRVQEQHVDSLDSYDAGHKQSCQAWRSYWPDAYILQKNQNSREYNLTVFHLDGQSASFKNALNCVMNDVNMAEHLAWTQWDFPVSHAAASIMDAAVIVFEQRQAAGEQDSGSCPLEAGQWLEASKYQNKAEDTGNTHTSNTATKTKTPSRHCFCCWD